MSAYATTSATSTAGTGEELSTDRKRTASGEMRVVHHDTFN